MRQVKSATWSSSAAQSSPTEKYCLQWANSKPGRAGQVLCRSEPGADGKTAGIRPGKHAAVARGPHARRVEAVLVIRSGDVQQMYRAYNHAAGRSGAGRQNRASERGGQSQFDARLHAAKSGQRRRFIWRWAEQQQQGDAGTAKAIQRRKGRNSPTRSAG